MLALVSTGFTAAGGEAGDGVGTTTGASADGFGAAVAGIGAELPCGVGAAACS